MFSLLGYATEELKARIEETFQDGMTWENYGTGPNDWHVDHIRPVASFNPADFASAEELVAECFKLSNLAAMWRQDNAAKSSIWNGHIWRKGEKHRSI